VERAWVRGCVGTAVSGRCHFQDFRPGFGFWHICHVDRHGHFTLKQLRLPVVNEMHTKSYKCPRLGAVLLSALVKDSRQFKQREKGLLKVVTVNLPKGLNPGSSINLIYNTIIQIKFLIKFNLDDRTIN
jgi:hypothetical protein